MSVHFCRSSCSSSRSSCHCGVVFVIDRVAVPVMCRAHIHFSILVYRTFFRCACTAARRRLARARTLARTLVLARQECRITELRGADCGAWTMEHGCSAARISHVRDAVPWLLWACMVYASCIIKCLEAQNGECLCACRPHTLISTHSPTFCRPFCLSSPWSACRPRQLRPHPP